MKMKPPTSRLVTPAARVPIRASRPELSPPPYVRVDAEDQRAQVRPSTKRADYEGGWQRVIVPSNGRTRVFETTRRWGGVDVYIALPAFTSVGVSPIIRFSIYAVIEGMDRVLVSTGIYRHNNFDPPDPTIPQYPSTWVCGARCAADRFQVELSFNQVPTNPGQDFVDVGVIAADEVVDLPKNLGVIPIMVNNFIIGSQAKAPTLVTGDPGWEVFSVEATQCAGAAPRWLHIHDLDTTNPLNLNGQGPVFSFGMPAIGHSVQIATELLRPLPFRFRRGLSVTPSDTGRTTTVSAVGDVAFQVFYR